MRRIRFIRDFDFQTLMSRDNCILCKVMGVKAYKASDLPLIVPEETARAALAAHAAIEVRE